MQIDTTITQIVESPGYGHDAITITDDAGIPVVIVLRRLDYVESDDSLRHRASNIARAMEKYKDNQREVCKARKKSQQV